MRKSSKIAASIVTGAALAVGGFAAATFTLSTGTDASGTIATPSNPTATASVTGELWPGYCQPVSVTFTNTNDKAVAIDSLTGTITVQPPVGVHPLSLTQDSNSQGNLTQFPVIGLVKWQGASDALAGSVVAAHDSATFTIPSAVCLSPEATNAVAGKAVTAHVSFTAHVVAGTAYKG